MYRVAVRRIDPSGNAPLGEPRAELVFPESKERTEAAPLPREHSGQPCGATAGEDPQEDGFDLVVFMVPKHDRVRSLGAADLFQPVVSCAAGNGL
jgi:hypothetical protein